LAKLASTPLSPLSPSSLPLSNTIGIESGGLPFFTEEGFSRTLVAPVFALFAVGSANFVLGFLSLASSGFSTSESEASEASGALLAELTPRSEHAVTKAL
jgi:hypothetical protein